jgi:acyl-ACP thioesterase
MNLFSILDLLQDIASDHAEMLGFGREDLIKKNQFWVLSRIYLVVNEFPVWEDTITVRTWHKGVDRLFGMRDFEIKFPDGKHIASAASSWLVIDRDSKKIQRLDTVLNSNSRMIDALPRNAAKLEKIQEENVISSSFRVKVSDLDVNLHTNNTRYLKWVTDTYDLDFSLKNAPFSVEINYLSESVYGDEIAISTAIGAPDRVIHDHCVFRIDGMGSEKRELCRIRLFWKEYNYAKS